MRATLTLSLVTTVGALAWAAGRTHSEAPIDAVAVAASVQTFYERTKSLRTRFHQTYFHRIYERYDRSEGRVVFSKPGKMRWDYDRPNGKVIVSDGRRLLVYEPGEGREPGQLFEQELSENQLPQVFAFLTGTARLEESFAFRLLDPRRQGFEAGYVLELRPRQATPNYERILFFVAKQEGRPIGVVRRVLIVDSAGNRNRFDFSEMSFNADAADSTFRFAPPANTRRVQP